MGGGAGAWTADRTEFLGRNGSLDAPAGLARGAILSRRTGAGLDPCAALQVRAASRSRDSARRSSSFSARAATRTRRGSSSCEIGPGIPRPRSPTCGAEWEDTLTALQVRTPDRSMDLMLNRWLLYQAVGCRFEARSAFYQAGGAWGFRDQLQDAMSFTVARRELTREQLLRAASRQFEEGDVQHWWHDPEGKGVRTRISDDLLWLPYATHHYVEVTGDRGVLDEKVPFLDSAAARAGGDRPVLRAAGLRAGRVALRALRAGARPQPRGRPPRPAADGHRGLERRDEPGRRGRAGRERLARLVPARSNLGQFAALADARGETRPRDGLARARGRAEDRARARRLGRRLVPPGLSSTTGRRSGPRRTTSAASIRSRSRGRSSPAPRIPSAAGGRWPRWTST